MILDLILFGIIVIIIGASTIDYRNVMERIREIQDDFWNLLDRIPRVFSLTILLMSSILIMSFLVAIVPKT
jgi:hypothetical protein